MVKLPEIPSEFIEPYLAKFMGSMIEFLSSAYITEEELAKHNGVGWTVAEVKHWVKGVEVFVSGSCGIHSRYAMINEMQKMTEMPDADLKILCRKITYESFDDKS